MTVSEDGRAGAPELRFFTVVRLHVDSEGRYRTNTPLMSVDEWRPFRELFSRVVLYARVTPGVVSNEGYLVGGAVKDVVPLPYYDGAVSFLRRKRVIARFLEAEIDDPGVVYGLWAPSAIAELVAKLTKRIGARLFVRLIGDSVAVAQSIAPVGLRSILARRADRTTRAVVATADAVAYVTLQALQQRYPAGPGAMTLARTNLRLGNRALDATPKAYAEVAAGARVSIIAVGSQQQNYKGHDLLISAVKVLRERGYGVDLTLVGDGRLHQALTRQAHDSGVGDVSFIRRIGTSDEVMSTLKQHDIFVMPSRTEGMPKALLEAMLSGVFSIGSDVGGIPEVLDPDCVFAPDSVSALVNKLERFLKEPASMPAIAAAQRERALDIWRNHSGEKLMANFIARFIEAGEKNDQPMIRRPRGRDVYARYQRLIDLLFAVVAALPMPARRRLLRFRRSSDSRVARVVRLATLRSLARACGELVDVHSQCTLLGVENLALGSRISIHPTCYIDATGGVAIGSDVSIAHQSTILSTSHSWSRPGVPIRDQPLEYRPTKIEDDVWIGAGVRVLGGVTIHSHSIVAAGAVVTKDVAPGSIVAGVPARKVGEVDIA